MDRKLRIMIAEDEVIISMRLELFFQRRGYEVIKSVTTGEEAIEIAKQEKPDIILMDINLRGKMSGIEAAEKIKDEIQTSLIFITGYSDDILKEKAAKLNPHGYFMKPVNMYEIISALNKIENQDK